MAIVATDIQAHLAQTQHTGNTAADLRKLASEADKYFGSNGTRVSAITESPNIETPEINAAFSQKKQPNQGSTFKFCYYHSRFFEKATKCKEPCDFKRRPGSKSGNGQAGRKQSNNL